MPSVSIEVLEPRIQCAANVINYGVSASGDPDQTGVLNAMGPGLKDLGAKGVRLFTNTSFMSSDFDLTPSGRIYVRNPSLQTALSNAKKYHNAGIAVTLCIQLNNDRSMFDGSALTDPVTGAARLMVPSELRSPKVFRTWYDTIAQARISAGDTTSVTKVVDFWEIGNEPNHLYGNYWPADPMLAPAPRIAAEMDSYVDHDLIPAYDVLHAIGEPVIGAGLASGTLDQFNSLNNQPGARHHQYSDHCDDLNFHPYGIFNDPITELTPQAEVEHFTTAIYDDGTVTKPFVITEYNIADFLHVYPLDPSASPRDAAEQLATVRDLDAAHTALLKTPHVQERCAWIYYYRLIAQSKRQRGAIYDPPPVGETAYTPLPAVYDMFKRWAKGSAVPTSPLSSSGVIKIDGKSVINAIAVQKDGKTLVASDDRVGRYDAKGKLDATFGKSGFARLPLTIKTMALQGDGKLIVAGAQMDASASPAPFHMVVIRLLPDGAADASFGTNGVFALRDGRGTMARSIALRAGKIVIAGASSNFADGIVIRLDLSGKLDKTLAGTGAVDIKRRGRFSDVAVAKSGAITVLLSPYEISPLTSVVRFTNAGVLDTSFSKDGITDAQPIISDGMFVDGDGSVTLIGHKPLAKNQVMVRYTASGDLATNPVTIAGTKFMRGSPIERPDGSRYLYGSIASGLTSDTRRIFIARLSADGQLSGTITLASKNLQDLPFASAIGADNAITIGAGTFTGPNEGGLFEELFRPEV